MEVYNIITLIIVLAAIFGYINFRFIKLSGTIGIMLLSLVASLVIIGLRFIHPPSFNKTIEVISRIDFHTALMKVMLSFLLFAGAIHMAGIITGNKSMEKAISITTQDYMRKFWEMIDEVMNAILFLLIGFEMLIVPFNITLLWLGCVSIIIVLLARLIAVSVPIFFLNKKNPFERYAIPILTWGGLRGGISVALALSLPKYMYGEVFVSITYIVVLFSIIVQGLTIGKLAKRLA